MPIAAQTATAIQLYLAEPSMTAAKQAYALVQEEWIRRDEDSGTTFRSLPSYKRVREYDRTTQGLASLVAPFEVADIIAFQEFIGSTAVSEPIKCVEVIPTAFDRIVAQLIRFESLGPDWDGNDASEPNLESLQDARAFVRSLAPESAVPEATLHADGTAALLLMVDDIYVELEFPGKHMVGYFARRGREEWNDDFSFEGGSLPDALCAIGFVIEKKHSIVAA